MIEEFYSNTNEEKKEQRPYKDEDYTDDGLLTVKKQLELIDESDAKDTQYINSIDELRELKQRVKMLGLNNLGLDIFTDTRRLNKTTRNKLQVEMHKYNSRDIDEIKAEFNDIVGTVLEEHPNIATLPVYKYTYDI